MRNKQKRMSWLNKKLNDGPALKVYIYKAFGIITTKCVTYAGMSRKKTHTHPHIEKDTIGKKEWETSTKITTTTAVAVLVAAAAATAAIALNVNRKWHTENHTKNLSSVINNEYYFGRNSLNGFNGNRKTFLLIASLFRVLQLVCWNLSKMRARTDKPSI